MSSTKQQSDYIGAKQAGSGSDVPSKCVE